MLNKILMSMGFAIVLTADIQFVEQFEPHNFSYMAASSEVAPCSNGFDDVDVCKLLS